MKRKIEKLLDIFFTKEFFMFLVVGGVNTINGMLFPILFSLFLDSDITYPISFIPSLAISYFLNSKFTFKERLSFGKLVKFYISYIPNFIIQYTIFLIVVKWLDWNRFIGIIIASVLGIPVTFVIMKVFAFKNESNKE